RSWVLVCWQWLEGSSCLSALPQPPGLLLKVVAARSRDVYAGGDTHQFLPPSEEGSRHQVLVPAGILSIGLAAAYYSGDSLGWKLFYVTGCLFVAVQNLEDWEEAVFNKSTGKVVLKTFSLYRKLLTLCRAGHDQAIAKLITTFLELHCLESPVELSQSSDSEVDGLGDQS
ncbi:hypothetical protein E2I00_012864, partial [Balaenoptera physalus]